MFITHLFQQQTPDSSKSPHSSPTTVVCNDNSVLSIPFLCVFAGFLAVYSTTRLDLNEFFKTLPGTDGCGDLLY